MLGQHHRLPLSAHSFHKCSPSPGNQNLPDFSPGSTDSGQKLRGGGEGGCAPQDPQRSRVDRSRCGQVQAPQHRPFPGVGVGGQACLHPQQLQPILAQASGGGGCWCCLSGPHSPFTTEPSSPCLPLGPKTPLHAPEAGTPSQFTLVQRVDWKKNMLFSAGTTSCKGNLRLGSREMGADRQSSRKLETLRTPFECLDPAMPETTHPWVFQFFGPMPFFFMLQ